MDAPLELPKVAPASGQVHLRGYEERDVDMILDLATDPYLHTIDRRLNTIGSLPQPADRQEAVAYIEHSSDHLVTGHGYSFCIADADTDRALGGIGLWLTAIASGRASAGYCIAPTHRGHGFAGAALTALTRFAWSIPEIHRVELYIETCNTASQRTAEAAGYRLEGLLRSHQEIGGRRVDMLLHAAIR